MSDTTMRRGDTWEEQIVVKLGGAVVDLATVTDMWMTVREKQATQDDVDDTNAVFQLKNGVEIVFSDPSNGVADLTAPPAKTRNLSKNRYYYDIQIKLSDGRIKTTQDGWIGVEGEATLST